ncbi:MAG: hypothetical protein R3E01_04965 [Pirellulaceae bacterium]|nr:hypothetical protein [Planctomycetales bacterium]
MKRPKWRINGTEQLEQREMLHGGGIGHHAAPLDAATIEDRAAALFERLDVNADAVINADDALSDRITAKLDGADADGDGGITADELTAFVVAKFENHTHADPPAAATVEGRVDALFERLGVADDAEGIVLADLTNTHLADRLAKADVGVDGADPDGIVTKQELIDYINAKIAAGPTGGHGHDGDCDNDDDSNADNNDDGTDDNTDDGSGDNTDDGTDGNTDDGNTDTGNGDNTDTGTGTTAGIIATGNSSGSFAGRPVRRGGRHH